MMPYEELTYSNEITIQDLIINSEKNTNIFKNKDLQFLHNTITAMKPGKWYPVVNSKMKKLLIKLKSTGYYSNLEFDKYKSHIKMKQNEKTK